MPPHTQQAERKGRRGREILKGLVAKRTSPRRMGTVSARDVRSPPKSRAWLLANACKGEAGVALAVQCGVVGNLLG